MNKFNNYFKNVLNEAYIRPDAGRKFRPGAPAKGLPAVPEKKLSEKQIIKHFENEAKKAVTALAKIHQKREGMDWEDALQGASETIAEIFHYMDLY